MRLSFLALFAGCQVTAHASLAALSQDAGATVAPATQNAEPSPADKAFEPLRKSFDNLVQSLRNSGGVQKEDEPALRAMRDRAAAFSHEFPTDPRGLAIELQISTWLGEDELVNDLYARLAKLLPDNPKIIGGQAQYALNHNRFVEVIEIVQRAKPDPATSPQAYMALSDALLAEHQFVEAAEALKAIPTATLAADPVIKVQVDENLKRRDGYDKEWQAEETIRAKEAAADDLPQALIMTPRGVIRVELFENEAPNTVANFISLAEQGFYNGTKFHRVMPNFMAQGGDANSKDGATGTPGMGDPGYLIPDEIARPDHRKHFTGTLAMAKTQAPNSAGSQFYITVTPTIHLNDVHTVFGRVLDGMDVARALQQDDVIETVTITRKREHPYVPSTLPLPGAATPPSTQPVIPPVTTAPTTAPESQPAATAPTTP